MDSTTEIDRNHHVAGYARVKVEEGDGNYGAGYSLYSAAWPLLREYPGHAFQSGLFGTWMFAESENPHVDGVWFYSDIEGGLGWWRDTEYPTESPKFIMGAVALGFSAWANGPGAGRGRDWSHPAGHYGIAQLSPNLLWPPDGLNLKQGVCGELLGWGYLPLPLTKAKSQTAGKNVPTGDQSWTLFFNAANFKGPATFVLPYFFSKPAVQDRRMTGRFLDRCPSRQHRQHAMETQHIPWAEARDKQGVRYGRMASTTFPARSEGVAPVMHRVTAYNRDALWNRVKDWLDGKGEPVDAVIDAAGACLQAFEGSAHVGWGIGGPGIGRDERIPIDTEALVRTVLPDGYTLGYERCRDLATTVEGTNGKLMQLPEYYRYEEAAPKWVAVKAEDVPAETGLHAVNFSRPQEGPPQVYVTPNDSSSCWKSPGPVAGPFKAYPGDGSEVMYYWYRFADQPAVLNADLSDTEREALQQRIEKIHAHWTKDQEYLAPPTVGTLAEIDPALIVEPPAGLEIGHVPIVTRQGPADSRS